MSLLRTARRAAVATSVHGRVQRSQQQTWAAQDAARAAAAPPTAPPPAPAAPPAAPPLAPAAAGLDPVDELERRIAVLRQLADLRAAGVLTDAEFEQQKARTLA
ncbi:MAG: SHOCT domain-containing protein [Cellulomonadaceae bacterium]|nr:SHOCT domain-containing protein [Cellulomonadaceae bacterium]